jgi:hypothetical protein
VITRTLEYHPADGSPKRDITVTIGPIEPDPEFADMMQAWLKVDGFPEPYAHPFPGVDGAQAVIIALRLAPVMARRMRPGEGRLTFCGEESEDLGFPPFPKKTIVERVRNFFSPSA